MGLVCQFFKLWASAWALPPANTDLLRTASAALRVASPKVAGTVAVAKHGLATTKATTAPSHSGHAQTYAERASASAVQ